jgi:SAM-dependent methyltransferase
MPNLLELGKWTIARYLAGSVARCGGVRCNVCDWQGKHFRSDTWHKHSICPACRSSVRHRLLLAAMGHLEPFTWQRIVQGKDILHFAPERAFRDRFRRAARKYVTADLTNTRRDLLLDISDMPTVAAGQFDLLIACDVLEHVPHDRRAMCEIFRVLRPGGYAVLTVPQKDGLAITFEDAGVVEPRERERLFGQSDHVRIYGSDFSTRLEEAGFRVTAVSETDFPSELVSRHVLFPCELSDHPLATNYRKVFFAHRPDTPIP